MVRISYHITINTAVYSWCIKCRFNIMKQMQDLPCDIHEALVNPSTSDIDVSFYQDIQVHFCDGKIQYNKVLLSILEPVIKEVIPDGPCDDIVIIYPERSLNILKNLSRQDDTHFSEEFQSGVEDEDEDNTSSRCSACCKVYPTKKKLRRHFYYKHYCDRDKNPNTEFSTRRHHQDVIVSGDVRKCPVSECGKTFARSQEVKRHIRTIHNPDRRTRFFCNFCDSSFNRKDNLVKHVSKLHPFELS